MKVSVRLGATIPTVQYGNLRPEIEITDVDLDKDVKEQVDAAIAAAAIIWGGIDDNIMAFVDEAAKAVGGGLQMEDRTAKLERQMKIIADKLELTKKAPK